MSSVSSTTGRETEGACATASRTETNSWSMGLRCYSGLLSQILLYRSKSSTRNPRHQPSRCQNVLPVKEKLLTYEGRSWSKQKWAYVMDVKYTTFCSRLQLGWPIAQALEVEIRPGWVRGASGLERDDRHLVPQDWEETKAQVQAEKKEHNKRRPTGITPERYLCLLRLPWASDHYITVNRTITVNNRKPACGSVN